MKGSKHISLGQLGYPVLERMPRPTPSRIFHKGSSRDVLDGLLAIARGHCQMMEPSRIAVEIVRAIKEARLGGPEEVLGEPLAGLSFLLPDIAGDIFCALQLRSARRDLGAFYTPRWIVRRIIRLALAGRSDAKLIDPACGAGAFLLEAGAVLAKRLGDRDEAAKRLHGIDRDPQALRVCREILLAHGFHLPEENLRCANALLEPWRSSHDPLGFDAVVGNPPYRNIVRLPESERVALKARYDTFRNKCDLYGLFIEAAARHLAPGGRLALLVSDSFLGTSSFAPLREMLFCETHGVSARLIERIAGRPFRDACVNVVTVVAQHDAKQEVKEPHRIRRVASRSSLSTHHSRGAGDDGKPCPRGFGGLVRFAVLDLEGRRKSCSRIDREELRRLCAKNASIPYDPKLFELARAIEKNTISLGDLAKVALGIKTGDDRRFVLRERPAEDYEHLVPCLRGRNVAPFRIDWGGEWLDYRPDILRGIHGARPRQRESFDRSEKLVLRETSGRHLVAAYDRARFFPLDTLHVLYPHDGAGVSMWYLLAILNSRTASFWYGLHHPGPHVKAAEVRALPVPPPTPSHRRASRKALADANRWIAETAPLCSSKAGSNDRSRRARSSRCLRFSKERLPMVPDSCFGENVRTDLLEMLSRAMTENQQASQEAAAQYLLDQISAAAYGIDLSSLPRQGDHP